jgi:two-component system OmpR family sensor kinase
MGLRITGDKDQLERVLTNIIGNALRFSPIGKPVTVVASRQDGSVRIAVRDEGPGIPVDQRSRVFERFWQADGSAPTGGGGAGLGLAISKRIIDAHDGEILVTDNQPNGACVVISLPMTSTLPTG